MILDFGNFIVLFLKFNFLKFVKDHSNQQFGILLDLYFFFKVFLNRVIYLIYFLNVRVQDWESEFTFCFAN